MALSDKPTVTTQELRDLLESRRPMTAREHWEQDIANTIGIADDEWMNASPEKKAERERKIREGNPFDERYVKRLRERAVSFYKWTGMDLLWDEELDGPVR
ncbi:MAG: hypothetical protein H6922_01555 [Pseudomonadaceae bacterium]|nr:hypothetical protein [Pseudomonadaceae bacterium]